MMYIDNLFFSNANSLSINDLQSFSFMIYPNPVSSIITIYSEVGVDEVDIFSLIGSKIDTRKAIDNKIDVSDLKSGVYFISYNKAFSKFIKK